MTSTNSSKVFICKLNYAVRELLEINFYVELNDRGKGYVSDIVFVTFTPSIANAQSLTGYSFTPEKRESMSFNRLDIRTLAAALEDNAKLLLNTPLDQVLTSPPVIYKKFCDSSKSPYKQAGQTASGRKLLSIQVSRHEEKSHITLHYSGTQGQKVRINFDTYQALAFAEELRFQANELARHTAYYQQQNKLAPPQSA